MTIDISSSQQFIEDDNAPHEVAVTDTETTVSSEPEISGDDPDEEQGDEQPVGIDEIAACQAPRFKALSGHTSFETSAAVENYPYSKRGRVKCTMHYWVETRKRFGDRLVKRSINPRTSRPNAPHPQEYHTLCWLYKNPQGHIKAMRVDITSHEQAIKWLAVIELNVGLANLNEMQMGHFRAHWTQVFKWHAESEIVKVDPAYRQAYQEWYTAMRKHIAESPFTNLLALPEKPTIPFIDPGSNQRA